MKSVAKSTIPIHHAQGKPNIRGKICCPGKTQSSADGRILGKPTWRKPSTWQNPETLPLQRCEETPFC